MRRAVGAVRRHLGVALLTTALVATVMTSRGNDLSLGLASLAVVLWFVGVVRPSTFQHVVRRRSRVLNALWIFALIVLAAMPGTARISAVERVARTLIDAGLARGAAIYVVEETFGPSTELVVEPDLGDAIRVRLESEAYFAIVDDDPGSRFAHPVHYAVVPVSGAPRFIDNEWLPTVNGLRWTADYDATTSGHRVTGLTNADFPFPRLDLSASLPAGSIAAAADRKIALVIDGGAPQRDWTDAFARKLDSDTLGIANVLGSLGYDVRRFGGYRGSVTPAARVNDVRREIARIAGEVSAGDEVVIYLNGHGGNGRFALFDRSGTREPLTYADIAEWIAGIPGQVPVRIVVDACRSGSAVEPLSKRDNTVVSTATDATNSAPGGLGSRPTFSAAIAAATSDPSADLDGNGKVSLDEALAVGSRAFKDLGSKLIATKGAPTVVAETAAGAVAPAAPPRPVGADPVAVPPPANVQPAPAVAPQANTGPSAPPRPTLTIVAPPPTPAALRFTAGTLPQLIAGRRYDGSSPAYSFCSPTPAGGTSACGPFPPTTNPTGGSPPYHFELGPGVGFPPIGMSVGKDGLLTGTPATPGTSTFSVCAIDLGASSVCRTVTVVVTPAPTPVPTDPPMAAQLTQTACSPPVQRGAGPYYPVTVKGTIQGPVGTYLQAGFVSPVDCGGWTRVGNECHRNAGNPPTANWTWSGFVDATFPSGGMHVGPDGPNLSFRCP